MNIIEPILAVAGTHPGRVAIEAGDRRVSYLELADRAAAWGGALRVAGAGTGSRIGIALRDTPDFLVALLAAAHAGLVAVPLDWRLRPAARHRLARQLGLALTLSPRATPGGGAAAELPLAELESAAPAAPVQSSPAPGGDAPCLLKLSSGTTGEPKAAICTHRDLDARLARNRLTFGTLGGGRYLSVLPLCFSGGSNFALWALREGATVILYPPLFAAPEYADAVDRYRPDLAFIVPSIARGLLDIAGADGAPLLERLPTLVCSTAPLAAAEKRALVQRVCTGFHEIYSNSAAGQIAALPPADIARHAESVGRPLASLQVEIVDTAGRAVAAGQAGRLRCRGPGVSAGYYGVPGDDAAERIEDGWCYTGDVARIDDAGFLHVDARADEVIIRGGINIQPADVEQALRQHPAVADAAVLGVPCAELGQRVVACIVMKTDAGEGELRAHLHRLLAPHQVPETLHRLDALPRTAAGKVRKPDLLAMLAPGTPTG